jgi:hypothetical protein
MNEHKVLLRVLEALQMNVNPEDTQVLKLLDVLAISLWNVMNIWNPENAIATSV